jgi:hypothetical protein
MSNTKGAANSADKKSPVEEVVDQANLKAVPAQGEPKTDQSEQAETVTTDESGAKESVKSRLAALVEKAKQNRQFFYGVAVGVAATAATMARLAKEKVEEVVELTVTEEPEDGVDESAA